MIHPWTPSKGRCLALALALPLLAACAPKSYVVKTPTPSAQVVANAPTPVAPLAISDERPQGARTFSSGTLPMALDTTDGPIEGFAYLRTHLASELASRLPGATLSDGATTPRLALREFRMLNHRTNGYTPLITFTLLGADLQTDRGTQRLGVFIKRAKVPVWSFDEIVEPTLNEPLSLVVRELAAKIIGNAYGAASSDAEVEALKAKLAGERTGTSYLDVYALGFSQNPKALPIVLELAKDEDEYIRLAAISSLGTLRATDQFGWLKSVYEGEGVWQDRAMALKAIGDLGTPEARAFLEQEAKRWEGDQDDRESRWFLNIIRLYL